MFNLIRMEIYNLKTIISFRVLLIVSSILGITFTIITFGSTLSKNGLESFSEAFWDTPLMVIFCAILAGLFIGSSFTNRTINLQITTGHSRFEILLSKTITYFIATIPLTLIYPIIVTIIYTIYWGWGSSFTEYTFFYMFRVITLSILLNFASCSFFILFTFIFQDIAKAISSSIVFYLLINAIGSLLGRISPFLNKFVKISPFFLARQIVDETFTHKEIIISIISAISYIFVIIFITYIIFRKQELK